MRTKKLKAEIEAKPVFDATSVASLDGGVTYPVFDSFSRTVTVDWSSATSASTIFTGSAVGSGWTSGLSGVTGTFKSSGTWWTYEDDLLTQQQRDIVIDVICEEIIGR